MTTITPATLRTQISAGRTGPLYMLTGDDDVEKAAVAGEFAEIVEEDLRVFNVDRLHGADVTVDDLVQATATLPMMAPRRVVIVMEADKLLVPRRESKAADEAQARLVSFLENPPRHATTVFVCGAVDRRRTAVKALEQQAQIVNCGEIATTDDAERWVRARASAQKVPLDPQAVRALAERAGRDLVRLRAGLERLALYGTGQGTITAEDVRQIVPPGPDEQVEFGVANAIGRNDVREALRQLSASLDAGVPPEMALGQIRVAAEKLPTSRLRRGIDALFRTDLALKSSSGGDRRILLERLVVELCEERRPTRRA
jgi:DNA polymerase-3 subunit delta